MESEITRPIPTWGRNIKNLIFAALAVNANADQLSLHPSSLDFTLL
jgi:hypothetical protein